MSSSNGKPFWKTLAFYEKIGGGVVALSAVITAWIGYRQLDMAYGEAREQREAAEQQRVYQERVFKATTTPYLALNQQYRGIEMETGESKAYEYEDGKLKSEKVTGKYAQLSRRKDPANPPATLIVKNYGTGPVLNCTARFVATRGNFISNGKNKFDKEEVTEVMVDPRNLMPGQESRVVGFPSCFGNLAREIHDAQGYIIFTCETLDGQKLEFKETFDMTQGYGAKPYPLLKMHAWGQKFPWEDERFGPPIE
jgi:hypothetical protein